MKPHRDPHVTRKPAWHLAIRLRKALEDNGISLPFSDPVEADETYVDGLEKNWREGKNTKAGRESVGETAVVGVRNRQTDNVATRVVKASRNRVTERYGRDLWENRYTIRAFPVEVIHENRR